MRDERKANNGEKRGYFLKLYTIETHMKEPFFIRTLRLKSNLLSPSNKNPPEAETGRGCYIIGFMCSDFLKIFEEFLHSDQNSSVVQKTARCLNKNSSLKLLS